MNMKMVIIFAIVLVLHLVNASQRKSNDELLEDEVMQSMLEGKPSFLWVGEVSYRHIEGLKVGS